MLDEDTYLIPELGGYAHDMRQRFGIQDWVLPTDLTITRNLV
jgi:hypothetical protein